MLYHSASTIAIPEYWNFPKDKSLWIKSCLDQPKIKAKAKSDADAAQAKADAAQKKAAKAQQAAAQLKKEAEAAKNPQGDH